jgi:hypothetical protein
LLADDSSQDCSGTKRNGKPCRKDGEYEHSGQFYCREHAEQIVYDLAFELVPHGFYAYTNSGLGINHRVLLFALRSWDEIMMARVLIEKLEALEHRIYHNRTTARIFHQHGGYWDQPGADQGGIVLDLIRDDLERLRSDGEEFESLWTNYCDLCRVTDDLEITAR